MELPLDDDYVDLENFDPKEWTLTNWNSVETTTAAAPQHIAQTYQNSSTETPSLSDDDDNTSMTSSPRSASSQPSPLKKRTVLPQASVVATPAASAEDDVPMPKIEKWDERAQQTWNNLFITANAKIQAAHAFADNHRRPFMPGYDLSVQNVICRLYQPHADGQENSIPVVLRASPSTRAAELSNYIRSQVTRDYVNNASLFLSVLQEFITWDDVRIEGYLRENAKVVWMPLDTDKIKEEPLDQIPVKFENGKWWIRGDACPRRVDVDRQYQAALVKVLAANRWDDKTLASTKALPKQPRFYKKAYHDRAINPWFANLFGLPASSIDKLASPFAITILALLDVTVGTSATADDKRQFANAMIEAVEQCGCKQLTACPPNFSCLNALLEKTSRENPKFFEVLKTAGFQVQPSEISAATMSDDDA